MEEGLAFVLNPAGAIVECLRNDFLDPKPTPGTLFVALFETGEQRSALDFFRHLHEHGSAFRWELQMAAAPKLQFAGGRADDLFLVVGTPLANQSDTLFEELIRMQHEQTNRIRQMARERSLAQSQSPGDERRLLEELTRVNNEFATLQRKLVRQNRELEHLGELKNRFVGMAAHDLRNPLGVIQGYCTFLIDQFTEENSADPRLRFLERIEKSANFMLRLVTDLLDISQLESGQLDLEICDNEFCGFVKEIVVLNQTLASPKGITISLLVSEEPLWLRLDPFKIEQVLNNLIGNAVKYSPRGSQIQVSVNQRQGEIECAVQDQGVGIPMEERDKLFQPFGRTSVKTTGGESSTGLGLAIAKRVVEGHRGRIGFTNVEPHGCRFFFTLPQGKV